MSFAPILSYARPPVKTASQGRATALENAVAYVRFTIYDVRFINNVRVAQILFGSLTYAEIPLDPSL